MFVLSVWGRLKRRLRFSDDLLEFQGQTAVYRPPASRALVDVVTLAQIACGECAAAERVVVNAVGQVVDIKEKTQVFTRLPSGVKVDDFGIAGDLAGRLNLSIDIYAFSHGVFARIADARTDCQAVVQPAHDGLKVLGARQRPGQGQVVDALGDLADGHVVAQVLGAVDDLLHVEDDVGALRLLQARLDAATGR